MKLSIISLCEECPRLRRALLAGMGLFYLLLLPSGFALDPAKNLTQYNCQTWSRQNGLLVNGINAIAQTKDGYLWVGTSVGLLRYDGTEFAPVHLARSGDTYVTSLASDPNGGLWVGLENNAIVFYGGDGLPARGDVPTTKVDWSNRTVKVDKDGALLIVANHHLARQSPAGIYEELLSLGDDQDTNILCGLMDSQKRLWFGTSEKGVFYLQAGKLHKLATAELDGEQVYALAEDHDGNLWIGTAKGLFCYDAGLQQKNIPALNTEVRTLLVDRQGVLWIGTGSQGLARYNQAEGKYDSFQRADGLPSNYVRVLAEDEEGSLWIGTRFGLCQLTDVKFPTYASSEDSNVQDALAVSASRLGGVWIGSTAGVSYFDGHLKTYGVEAGLPYPAVKRMFEARNGDLYLVCGNKNLAIFSGGKVVANYARTNLIVGMAEDDKGVVVSVGGSLYRAGRDYFFPYAFTNDAIPPLYWVENLASGRDGVIWVACANGISRIKDGTYQQWTTAQGLSDSEVNWICEDNEGVVWAAMSTGIARLKDNQIKCISEVNGLFDNNIYAIVPDDLGNLWVDSGRGIYRVSRKSMNDFADGRTQRVECAVFNGVESVKPADKTFQERVGCKTLDGRIWFPSANGVVAINPRQIPVNEAGPPVHLLAIRANERDYSRSERLVVPPGDGELEFHFNALSFISPQKVRFRYQLEGYDKNWVEAGDRRLAFYTNLKPGRYTFRVIAANADGVWNKNGDAISIELRPHFYQTIWCYLLYAGLALGVFAGVFAWRMRFLSGQQRALQQQHDLLEQRVKARTEELACERDLFRSLLDNASDRIYFKDKDSKFVRCSRSKWTRTSASELEIIGKTDFDLFHEEHARPAFEDEQEIIRTGQPLIGKLEKEVHPDGRTTWVLTTKMPWRDSSGKIVGTFGISKDITAMKTTEAELAYERDLLRALLDNSPDQIYFKDLQSRFLKSSNAQMAHFRVKSVDEIVGKTDFDFFTDEHARPAFEDEQEIIRTGRPIIGKVEKEVQNDGRVTWAISNKMPLRNVRGEVVGTFGISKDITTIKEAEAKLEAAHRQLVDASRQAGMAEVATSVLHNVGNVLNSVNVSTTLVYETIKKSRINHLGRLAAKINEHREHLAAYFTSDPNGTQLPDYLTQLAEHLAQEQTELLKEAELTRKNVEHIKDIVAMQQSYAKVSGVTEKVKVEDLVEDALRMNGGSLERHGVEVIRDYPAAAIEISVERQKVLQVLVNLIRNAKYACDESGRQEKRLTMRVRQAGGRVQIGVVDNGVGIPAENLTRIFNHGFTTREDGHGFGLHSGALAAKEMGGTLNVHSDGPDTGASFVLELPLQPPSNL